MLRLKRVFFLLLVVSLSLSACVASKAGIDNNTNNLQSGGKLQLTVSILPQKWFVDRIAGDLVAVQTLVGSGDDPHTYEPSPSQMAALEKSVLYFTIGIEFEEAWMDKLSAANKTMKIVDSSAGIERIPMVGGHHHHEETHETEAVHHDEIDGLDPHIWFSPDNAKQIAKNIAGALIEQDPKHESVYTSHLETLLEDITRTDAEIKSLLQNVSRRHFMIVHPAWGYFARSYNLQMIPVEIGGNEPAPGDLAEILEAAREYQISALFVEKGSNMNLARSVASQAGISEIIEWDPMAYEWIENMLSLGRDLQNALR